MYVISVYAFLFQWLSFYCLTYFLYKFLDNIGNWYWISLGASCLLWQGISLCILQRFALRLQPAAGIVFGGGFRIRSRIRGPSIARRSGDRESWPPQSRIMQILAWRTHGADSWTNQQLPCVTLASCVHNLCEFLVLVQICFRDLLLLIL